MEPGGSAQAATWFLWCLRQHQASQGRSALGLFQKPRTPFVASDPLSLLLLDSAMLQLPRNDRGTSQHRIHFTTAPCSARPRSLQNILDVFAGRDHASFEPRIPHNKHFVPWSLPTCPQQQTPP